MRLALDRPSAYWGTNLGAELRRLLKARLRYEDPIRCYGADRLERVAERSDGVEANVGIDCWLVENADTAGFRKAARWLGLVYESAKDANTAGWVATAPEGSVQFVIRHNVTYTWRQSVTRSNNCLACEFWKLANNQFSRPSGCTLWDTCELSLNKNQT